MGSKIIKKNSHPDLHNVTMSFVSSRVVTHVHEIDEICSCLNPQAALRGKMGLGDGKQAEASLSLPVGVLKTNATEHCLSQTSLIQTH